MHDNQNDYRIPYYKKIHNLNDLNKKYGDGIPIMPDIVHLHDSVFPEEENIIEDIPLDENYDYNRDNPYYATDPETWWWNKKNLFPHTSEERVREYLGNCSNMDELNKYSDEEFEQIMRELEKPPNSLNEYEYCETITERLKNNPPVPEDVLFLHDAVFMDREYIPDVELSFDTEKLYPSLNHNQFIDRIQETIDFEKKLSDLESK